MKSAKCLLSAIMVLLAVFCIGCSSDNNTGVKKAISAELEPLKGLNSEDAFSYLTQGDLFKDSSFSPDEKPSEEVKDVFSLFFKNFDYEILSVNVSEDGKTAKANVRLTTIDAESLSRDFASSALREAVESAAHNGSGSSSMSTEERYLLLNHLLKTGSYSSLESDCTVTLTEGENGWAVNHTSQLENQLVGGLVSWLSDPYILTPEETLGIYMNTIRKMSVSDLSSYLGITNLSSQSGDDLNRIYQAMLEQVHDHFNYEILGSNVNGSSAEVQCRITTFDSDAVMEAYNTKMDEYLATPDAVIEGADARLSYSRDTLLSCLKGNTAVVEKDCTFRMKNDGVSWKLNDPGSVLGEALFGSIEIAES